MNEDDRRETKEEEPRFSAHGGRLSKIDATGKRNCQR